MADFHEVDSSELAFKVACSIALRDGVQEAGPVLLEPVMSTEIVAPEEFVGEVVGDLNARRAQIESLDSAIGRHSGCKCRRAVGRDVWLCYGSAFDDAGTWNVYDGILALC